MNQHLGDITFLWPRLLWLLTAVPVLITAYVLLVRRRSPVAVRYASLGLVDAHAGKAWRRHLPALFFLAGLVAMLVAVARPQTVVLMPSRIESVMLAMDMSGSMRATDVKPSRMVAAQEAAKVFIDAQPHDIRVGVVAVAGAAALVQSPTKLRERTIEAINGLNIQRGTALGSGLLIALSSLLPGADIDVDRLMGGQPARGRGGEPDPEAQAVAPGSNQSVAIVLLSDGQSNTGPEPMKIVEVAAQHGVRIHTVGVGTQEGDTLSVDGWSMRVRLDDEVLKRIAAQSGGEYFRAENADELKKIYGALSMRLAFDKQEAMEVTALLAALGVMLVTMGAALSLWWFGRVM